MADTAAGKQKALEMAVDILNIQKQSETAKNAAKLGQFQHGKVGDPYKQSMIDYSGLGYMAGRKN